MSKWKNFFLENVSTLLPSVQFRFFGKKSKYVISKPYTLTYYQSSHALSKRWISTKQLGPAPIAFFMVNSKRRMTLIFLLTYWPDPVEFFHIQKISNGYFGYISVYPWIQNGYKMDILDIFWILSMDNIWIFL